LVGEQKLEDFLVGKAKIGEKQSRQSNSKYNLMQYVRYLSKKVYAGTMGSGVKPQKLGNFQEFLC